MRRHVKKAKNLTRFLTGLAAVVVGFWLIMGSLSAHMIKRG
jgi:hypothetical protein